MPTTSARLLALLSLLQARRDWSGDALAERLDVSSRTVRRDMDRLRQLGYRIATLKGPDGGYRLDAGSELPPMLFDDDQAIALAVALQVASVSGAGTGEAALRALATVRQVMPSRLRHRVDALAVTPVRPPPESGSEVDPAVLLAVSAAARAGEVLRFDYSPSSGVDSGSADDPDDPAGGETPPAVAPRRVEPHHVATWRGRWYLVAWDLDREDWRTYRVDRIAPRIPNGPKFTTRELPGGDVGTFLTDRFRGEEGSRQWLCVGEAVIDLPFSEVAPFVEDGAAEPEGTERTRVRIGSWSWTGVVATLVRFEADVEVVGPSELRDAFSAAERRCRRAAGRDDGGQDPERRE